MKKYQIGERRKNMEIVETRKNEWSILSDSGNIYTVKMETKLDSMGSMYFRWNCDCPSRKQPCKHQIAIQNKYCATDDQAGEREE